jgi:hypothetical protein
LYCKPMSEGSEKVWLHVSMSDQQLMMSSQEMTSYHFCWDWYWDT